MSETPGAGEHDDHDHDHDIDVGHGQADHSVLPDKVPAATAAPDSPAKGNPLSNLSLLSKLLLMLLLTSLSSAGLIAWIGYSNGNAALTKQAFSQLESLRSSKKQQIEWYFKNMRDTFRTFGEDVTVVSAMSAFKDGFAQLGTASLTPDRRNALRKFYSDDVVPKISASRLGTPQLQNLVPRNDRATELQALYISENPDKADRSQLADHPVSNAYTLAHFTYHPWFRGLAGRLNFYDVMLIDGDSGNVVYTVAKEIDLGGSLIDGPFANSSLGQLFKQVVKNQQRGDVKLVDFAFYQPSYNAPSMFIATPIYANWKFLGVLVAQVSDKSINDFMTNNGAWKKQGLGDSGELFLAGEDKLMRTNSRFLLEDKPGYVKTLEAAGVNEDQIGGIDAMNSTMLLQSADTEALRAALRGETSTVEYNDYRGVATLGSFAPLSIPDLHWALVVKQDIAEVLRPQTDFARNVMLATCLLALLIPLIAMFLARRFLRPLNALLAGIEKLRSGQAAVAVETRGNDEFGRLTTAFNTMAQTVRDRDDTILGKSRAYEALLRHIFPDVIADRMKKGEGQIVESLPQVSVIFASIHGFVQVTDQMDGEQSIALLNEIVDAFDAAAEELGIEKVKTMGEHYLAACGLTVTRLDHARRAVDFADRMAVELARIAKREQLSLQLRIGIDSGRVHAGLVGNRKFFYDVWGKPPNVARGIVNETGINEVRLSEDTYQILRQPADFTSCEVFESKSLGSMRTWGRQLVLTGKPAAALERPISGDKSALAQKDRVRVSAVVQGKS